MNRDQGDFGKILTKNEQDFFLWLDDQQKEISNAQAEINSLKTNFENQIKQLEIEKKNLLHQLNLKSQQKKEVYDDHSKYISANAKLQSEIQEISHDFDLRDQYIDILQKKKAALISKIQEASPSNNIKQELNIYETLYGMHFQVSVINKQVIHKIISFSGKSWVTFTLNDNQLIINESESKFPLSPTPGHLFSYSKTPLTNAIQSFNDTFNWPSFLLFLSQYLK